MSNKPPDYTDSKSDFENDMKSNAAVLHQGEYIMKARPLPATCDSCGAPTREVKKLLGTPRCSFCGKGFDDNRVN